MSDLLPVSRVAAMLGCSRKRVYQLIELGRLESLRLGPRGLRVPRKSIDAYVAQQMERQKKDLGLDLQMDEGRWRYRRTT